MEVCRPRWALHAIGRSLAQSNYYNLVQLYYNLVQRLYGRLTA